MLASTQCFRPAPLVQYTRNRMPVRGQNPIGGHDWRESGRIGGQEGAPCSFTLGSSWRRSDGRDTTAGVCSGRILRSGSNSPCTSCRPAGPACSNATASAGRSWLRATKTTSVLLCCAAEIRADVHPRQNQNGCIIRAPHPPCSLCTPGCGRSSGARRSFACATASAASRWISLATGSVNSDPTPKSPWRVMPGSWIGSARHWNSLMSRSSCMTWAASWGCSGPSAIPTRCGRWWRRTPSPGRQIDWPCAGCCA